jgi:hypothetical protein
MAWWLKSSRTNMKHDVINAGTITALLVIKECDKVAPVLLISPSSADHIGAYIFQASNNLLLSSRHTFQRPTQQSASVESWIRQKIPALILLPITVPIGFGKLPPQWQPRQIRNSYSIPSKTLTPSKHRATAPLTWYPSHHKNGKSHPPSQRSLPRPVIRLCPGYGHHPKHLEQSLTNNIYIIIETMTAPDNLEYTDQSNLAQQQALYQHQKCIRRNPAAYAASSNTLMAAALNNVASIAGRSSTMDPVIKKQHTTALHLICLQVDGRSKYSIPEKLNLPLIENILHKSGMNAMGPMELK